MFTIASGCSVPGTCTKMVRTRPLFSVSTSSSRSLEAAIRSSRSRMAASSVGATATPSSWVSTPSTSAARRRISLTAAPCTRPLRMVSRSARVTLVVAISVSTYSR